MADWIAERIAGLFDVLGSGGPGAVIGWILVLAAVAGVVALLVVGWRRRARGRSPRPADEAPDLAVTVRRPAAEWRSEAAAHAAAGRWLDALRCRYRAVVADLTDRGVVDASPGTTTGAERTQVATALPVAAEPFAAVSDAFDRGVYGAQPVGPEVLADADALDAVVASALGATPGERR